MKLLYVLVSQETDCYYEQALLSVMSAKYHMPGISIALLMDEKTNDSIKGNRERILDYIDECNVVPFDDSVNAMIRSRSLKTSMHKYVAGDLLYVDVDTLWVGAIDFKDFDGDIMGVPDGNVKFENFKWKEIHQTFANKLNFKINTDFFINGGVLFVKDSPVAHSFMDDWNRWWKYSCDKGVFTDQQSLNYVNSYKVGVAKPLPDFYNVQIDFSIRYLLGAKLIHYFSSGLQTAESEEFFELKKKSFWQSVKISNKQLETFQRIIQNPNKCFSAAMVKLNNEDKLFKNPSYGLLRDLILSSKKKNKIILGIVNYLAKLYCCTFKIFAK
ncbi:MAG: hypothetical protein J6W54_10665 [Fibrobacter sp.]|uniref:hypothetical protein n=1 Tax=Fibrobacter sp. TaxID=35828 RepID=UPI001B0098CB|nr:hypothetical protein [Fibrobacter sp.]MBO7061536.1 hypothetical protein [Fibrobacter sp.]